MTREHHFEIKAHKLTKELYQAIEKKDWRSSLELSSNLSVVSDVLRRLRFSQELLNQVDICQAKALSYFEKESAKIEKEILKLKKTKNILSKYKSKEVT